jgi:hypothetical protein
MLAMLAMTKVGVVVIVATLLIVAFATREKK